MYCFGSKAVVIDQVVARLNIGFFVTNSRTSSLAIIRLPGLRRFGDYFFAVHIWAENFRYRYRAVGVLVKLQDRDQDSRRGDDGVVERVTENVLLRGRLFVAEIHSPGLELIELAGAVRFAIITA